MHTLFKDTRYAIRALLSRPSYALVTVLVLTLAIGANTTVFSVFNGLFLRPLPYPQDDRLVAVYNAYPKMGLAIAGTSIPDYLDRREQAPSLEDIAIYTPTTRALSGDGTPEQVQLVRASPSLFSVLGVAPVLGRAFTEAEATPGNDRVAVLSYTVWQTRFGGRTDVLGEDIELDGQPFTIVGVMPEAFAFPNRSVAAWLPFAFTPEQMSDASRGMEFSSSIGRLRPGATVDGLNAEMDAIVRGNIERLADARSYVETTGFTGRARLLRDMAVGDLEQMLLILQATVLAVLLIACANVANLQLARIVARRKELSVRSALGASRGRLVRLVLVESFVLGILGGLGGLLLTRLGLGLVSGLGLDRVGQGFQFVMDSTVIGFTAGATLLTVLLSGLVPLAALLREDLARAMHEAGRLGGGGRSTRSFRSALVVVQIAVSVALLVGAGLLTKSFYVLEREGAGFNAENVWTARITLPPNRYPSGESQARFYEQALEALRALPGVSDAGFTTALPFAGNNPQGSVTVDGYTPPAGVSPPHAQQRSISEGYLTSLEIPVVRGRNFSATESEPVAIIDENMANKYWPDGAALGARVRNNFRGPWSTIVGIVPPVKHGSLVEEASKETIYWHYKQAPEASGELTLRTSLPPEALTNAATAAIARLDPGLPLSNVMSMDARVLRSLGPQRAPMVLTLVFAAGAFTLAIVGIYGVLTWAVTQRFGEIGVRMAFGAKSADIVRMVLGQGVRMIAIGVVFGLAGALGLGRIMASQIRNVSAADPTVFGIAVAGLIAAALLASWLPARRAAGIDPIRALREE